MVNIHCSLSWPCKTERSLKNDKYFSKSEIEVT